jgi:hypothetical protein
LLELPRLADVFVRNVTIIIIIYFTEYQVVQREAKSSSIVHMVNYIMLAPYRPYSLLLSLAIIIYIFKKKKGHIWPGVVVHIHNPSTWEVEVAEKWLSLKPAWATG